METIIKFENVDFAYSQEGRQILNNLSLDIHKGEFTCILGHNGSGKSTTAKLMNALLLPVSGKVTVYGLDTADESLENEIRRHIGMVFQNPDNQIVATIVEDDVAFGPENLGLEPSEIRRRVDSSLKAVGMYEYRRQEPQRLSAGQKQRVAIAGVLAMQPECVVLDEPTAMLDPRGRRDILAALKMLKNELGITVILVTHFMEEAIDADRVIVLNNGTAALDGTPAEVFNNINELREMGLEVPKPTELAAELRKCGLPVGENILTAEDFAKEFKKLI